MSVPAGLPELLQDFTEAALLRNPENINAFGMEFFQSRLGDITANKENQPGATESTNDRPLKRSRLDHCSNPDPESDDEVHEMNYFPPTLSHHKRKSVFSPAPSIHELTLHRNEVPTIVKPLEVKMKLRQRLSEIFLFKDIQGDELESVIDKMYIRNTIPGEKIINQGDNGDYFYVVNHGLFDVFVHGVHVAEYKNSGSFGELALLHDCPRAATVHSVGHGSLACLDRKIFRATVLVSAMVRRKQYDEFLKSMCLLKDLTSEERMRLADALQPCTYIHGQRIIYQGDPPDNFFLLVSGTARVTRYIEATKLEVELAVLEPGSYFGELALLTDRPRAASVWAQGEVQCARLSRQEFERLMGPCKDVMKRQAGGYEQRLQELLGPSPNGYLGLELSTL
eukprot:m.522900 g.522900  ORF g.522900 m.522900 type:complete len:396 (-) comp21972_c0_seq2:2229-3416(-)